MILVLHQVPLVDHHHQRLVVLLNELEDVHVLRLDASRGINHEDAHVTVLNAADAAHHRIKLKILGNFILSTDAGCVDQVEIKSKLVKPRIDTVTRGAGYFGHDVAVLTDEGIDDATLAHVGPSHHSKARNVVFQFFLTLGRQLLQYQVKQIARAATCCGTDTPWLAQTQAIELGSRVILGAVVNLVAHKDDGQLCSTQNLRHVGIPVGQSVLHIHHEEHQVGLFGSHDNLSADGVFKDIIRVDYPPSGIHHGELAPVPTTFSILTVAGGTGSITYNRLARLC